MKYLFDPDELAKDRTVPEGQVRYVYEAGLTLAINVALAAERPLLLRGAPGSGKTTLARDMAWLLGRRFDPSVISSGTQARDLEATFDAVRRLADAQGDAASRERAQHPEAYVVPGALWRAFDPDSARAHRAPISAKEPRDVVLLLDEIDKADPDVPNDLLMVLDQRWFRVAELPADEQVIAHGDVKVFIVITTNGERELAPAFVRRCVTYDLPDPDDERLRAIAASHAPGFDAGLRDAIIKLLRQLAERAAKNKQARLRAPSTAEFVDALRACRELQIVDALSADWTAIGEAAMWKHSPADEKDGGRK